MQEFPGFKGKKVQISIRDNLQSHQSINHSKQGLKDCAEEIKGSEYLTRDGTTRDTTNYKYH